MGLLGLETTQQQQKARPIDPNNAEELSGPGLATVACFMVQGATGPPRAGQRDQWSANAETVRETVRRNYAALVKCHFL